MNTKTNKFAFIDKEDYILIRDLVFIKCANCNRKFYVKKNNIEKTGMVSGGPASPTTICPNCKYESHLWLREYSH